MIASLLNVQKKNAQPHQVLLFQIQRQKNQTKAPSLQSVTAKKDDNGKSIALDVAVGDKVLFGKYAGQTVKVDGEELLVMTESDIMAIVE